MRMLGIGLVLLAAGCAALLPDTTPQKIFALRPAPAAASDAAAPVAWQLQVARPVASRMLDSARIAVLPTPGEVQFYRDAAWSDSAPELLEALVVHAFEDGGRLPGVGRQSSGLHGDYLLLLDLRALQAEYRDGAAAPLTVVAFGAKLVNPASNRVLASRQFRSERPAASTALPDVVRALEFGLGEEIGELVAWTLRVGEANAQGVGPAPAGR